MKRTWYFLFIWILSCNSFCSTIYGQVIDNSLTSRIDSIISVIERSEEGASVEEHYTSLKKLCYSAKPYINKLRTYQWALTRFDHSQNVDLFGYIYSEMGGLYDDPAIYHIDSSKYYLDTVLVFIDDLQPFIKLNTYSKLTSTYKFLKIYEDAISYCLKGIAIGEEIGNEYHLKNLYYQMASISEKHLKDKDIIKEYLDKSLALAIKEGDPKAIAFFYHRYGNKIAAVGEYELAFAALDSCEKYVNIPEVFETDYGQVVFVSLHLTKGILYGKLGSLEEAESNLLVALSGSKKNKFRERLKHVPMELARVYIDKGKYNKAIHEILAVFKSSKSDMILHDWELGNNILHEAYDSLGNHERSLFYLKEWTTNKDSISALNDLNIIAGLESKYKNKEQKKEISFQRDRIDLQSKQRRVMIAFLAALSLLSFGLFMLYRKVRSSKEKINKQKDIILLSLEEKEILLKEVHHRVKNNLQVMSGLLQIQSNNSDNEELKRILHQSRNRIYSIAIIHELLYQDKEIKEISAQDYLLKILEQNDAIQENKAELSVNANGITLSMDQAIPIGLMLNEMAINSYKHGFIEGKQGVIEVSLQEESSSEKPYRFVFRDNGKGIPADLDISKTKSLGLRLIKMMCKQLSATLEFNNNNGAQIDVNF